MERTHSLLGLLVIAATCAAGLLSAPWWAGVAGACALVLVSLNGHSLEYARFERFADYTGQSSLLVAAALNASASAGVAFLAGRAIGWLWGV